MTNEIAKVNTSVPAYLKGIETHSADVNLSEIKIPAIRVGQPTSEDVVNGKAKFGEIYSSIGDTFGESCEFIVIKPFINYVTFEDGKLAGRSNNSTVWEEGKLAGQPIDQANAWKFKRYNFYVLPTNAKEPIPYVVSMYSTSGAKEGQKLYNLISISIVKDKIPCFAKTYKFSTNKEKNELGQFAAWKVENTGTFVSEDMFKVAADARSFVDLNSSVIVHDEPAVKPEVKTASQPMSAEF